MFWVAKQQRWVSSWAPQRHGKQPKGLDCHLRAQGCAKRPWTAGQQLRAPAPYCMTACSKSSGAVCMTCPFMRACFDTGFMKTHSCCTWHLHVAIASHSEWLRAVANSCISHCSTCSLFGVIPPCHSFDPQEKGLHCLEQHSNGRASNPGR